jgi:ABC-type polysaccharide/polyol phosphate transport system ATPase subunit
MANDLTCRGVSKRYYKPAAQSPGASLLQRALRDFRREEFWALREVSFDVARGEALGIIGHNGAGKSTLLRILSRITPPTRGEIRIEGRLAGLIELSAGFHPELSGRENAMLSGVILGLSRREIRRLMPAIAEFSGLGEFLDTPVKHYSSGMYVRLGFAIAAHLDPDILLLDEVLAVGDVGFQHKCLGRIRDLKQAGHTIVLISHDLAAIERFCDRVLLLERGQIVREGTAGEVTLAYQQSALAHAEPLESAGELARTVSCRGFEYYAAGDGPGRPARTGGGMTLAVDYTAREAVDGVIVTVRIFWPSGWLCTEVGTGPAGVALDAGAGRIEFHVPVVNLRPGVFLVDVVIERPPVAFDIRYRCATLHVLPGDDPVVGDLLMPSETRVLAPRRSGITLSR